MSKLPSSDFDSHKYYFEKLYPMGLMAKFDSSKNDSKKGDILQLFKITHMNEAFCYNAINCTTTKKYGLKKIEDYFNRKEEISPSLDYKKIFSDYIIQPFSKRREYFELLKEIVKFYTDISSFYNENSNLIKNGKPADYYKEFVEAKFQEINQENKSHFELVNEEWKRTRDLPLLIIKSKVPEGLKSHFNSEGSKSKPQDNIIYIDIYAVPQIFNGKLHGIQNVIPEVNERRKILNTSYDQEKKVEYQRSFLHNQKSIYFLLSDALIDANKKTVQRVQQSMFISSLTFDWLNTNKPKDHDKYSYNIEVDLIKFLNSIYLHALILEKQFIETLPLAFWKDIQSKLNNYITISLKSVGEIDTESLKRMLSISDAWEYILNPGNELDIKEIKQCTKINGFRISNHVEEKLYLNLPTEKIGSVDKPWFYCVCECFFEIFINHIKHSFGSEFHIYHIDKSLIFGNNEYNKGENTQLKKKFLHVDDILTSDEEKRKNGLRSINSNLKNLSKKIELFVHQENDSFALKLNLDNCKILTLNNVYE